MDDVNKQNINDVPEEIRNFLEEILRDAGMTSLDQKMHDDMIIELFLRLDDYIMGTIMEQLPQDKTEEFTKMAEDGKSREELQQYLQTQVPNANEVFANAMIDFRNLYISEAGKAEDAQIENGTDNNQ